MSKAVGFVVLASVLAWSLWLSAPSVKRGLGVSKAAAAESANGAGLYGEFCERCHGAQKSGLEVFEGELADLEVLLTGGSPYMPDFTGLFTDGEVGDIYAYLTASDDVN